MPQVGIVNPSEMQPSSSVEIAVWVAVGGRGTLAGALLGAFVVNSAKSWLTVEFPNAWLFVLGALFVVVTLVLPGGLLQVFAGLGRIRGFVARAARRTSSAPPATTAPAEDPRS